MKIAIVNACGFNADYNYGLVAALARQGGFSIDLLDSNQSLHLYDGFPNVRVYSLLGQEGAAVPLWYKAWRQVRYYWRLFWYVVSTDAGVFHIQWLNRFELFERIVVVPWIRMMGKRLVYTAHNVDTHARDDGRSSLLNRMTLRFLYRRIDRIIAHTKSIRAELLAQFGVPIERISVIQHGILGDQSGRREVAQQQARTDLGIPLGARVLLFFGSWAPYKGLDLLIRALSPAISSDPSLHLVVAGPARNDSYRREIQSLVRESHLEDRVTMCPAFVPDSAVETYFSASDCIVLPYRRISQSGVPFLAYGFGLPVLASRVGGLPETVIPGVTGLLFEPNNTTALADAVSRYFTSDLYRNLSRNRARIVELARAAFSWDTAAALTGEIYRSLAPADDAQRQVPLLLPKPNSEYR